MAAEVVIDIRAEDSFSGVLGNFGSILTGIESAINLVQGAFQAASDAIQPFIDSASDSEQAVARLEGVLHATGGAAGLTSDQLQELASNIQNVTRFSDEEVMSAEALMLTFRNVSGDVFPRAIAAAVDMAEVFGSLESSTMQLGKALQDPVSMMGALSRAGVTFTDAQKDMIKHFVEIGDVAAAQNIILTEVENQVGGLAEVMGNTFAGQVAIAKNKLDEMREVLGGPILFLLGELLNKFMEFADTNPVIQGVLGFFQRWNDLMRSEGDIPIISALGAAMMTMENISPIFYDLGYALIVFQGALNTGATPLEAFKRALDDLARPGGSLAGVATFIQDIITAFETGDWSTVWDKIKTAILTGWGIIAPVIDDFIAGVLMRMEGSVNNWIQTGGPDRLSNQILDGLTRTFESPTFQSNAGIAMAALGRTLAGALLIIGTHLEVAGTDAMRNFWNGMEVGGTDALRDFMNNLETSITDGLRNGLNNVELGITDWVREKIVDPIKRFLGIASPSTVFFEIGKDIVRGLVGGLDSLVDWAIGAIRGIVSDILSPFDPILDLLGIDLGGATGTTGGRIPGTGDTRTDTTTGTGGVLSAATVTNNYNFYAPVYMSGVGPEGTYDCAPNPVISTTSGGTTGGRTPVRT